MLQKLEEHIAECLRQAADAEQRAAAAADPEAKADHLGLSVRWAFLARSYQFADSLERFLREGARNAAPPIPPLAVWTGQGCPALEEASRTRPPGLAPWESISAAPFDRDLELAVINRSGIHALVFPCRRILGAWLDTTTNEQIAVHPTHWRAW